VDAPRIDPAAVVDPTPAVEEFEILLTANADVVPAPTVVAVPRIAPTAVVEPDPTVEEITDDVA
jgi:hypothetical protein